MPMYNVFYVTTIPYRKLPIREIHLDRLLSEVGISQEEFIDLCILLGCDYCDSIKGPYIHVAAKAP